MVDKVDLQEHVRMFKTYGTSVNTCSKAASPSCAPGFLPPSALLTRGMWYRSYGYRFSQNSLSVVFTFKAKRSKLLLLRLVRLLPLRILSFLQRKDLLDRGLLERLGHVVVLIQILGLVSQEFPSWGCAQTYDFSK